MTDLEVDIKALRDFRDNAQDLLDAIQNDTTLSDRLRQVGAASGGSGLDLGQGLSGFESAHTLATAYNTRLSDWMASLNAFCRAVGVLGAAAATLADNYEAAKDLDAISAQAVDDALAAAQPLTGQQPNGTKPS